MEPVRPRSEAELKAEFIERNKIFQMEPEEGLLQPGQGCTVLLLLYYCLTGVPGRPARNCSLLSWLLCTDDSLLPGG